MKSLSQEEYEITRKQSDYVFRQCFDTPEGRKSSKAALGLSDGSVTKWLAPDRYEDAPKQNIDTLTHLITSLGLKVVAAHAKCYDDDHCMVISDKLGVEGARAMRFKAIILEIAATNPNNQQKLAEAVLRHIREG